MPARPGRNQDSPIEPLEARRLFSVAATATAAPPPALRVDAGGDWFTDSLARTWRADIGFTGGSAVSGPVYDVLGTADDALFCSYREGSLFSFAAPVAEGHYALWLEFAEPDAAAVAGQRVFSVRAEGATVLDDFDVTAAAAGAPQQAVAACADVTVADGSIDLSFAASAGQAMVSAILLVPTDPPPVAAPYSWQALSPAARVVTDAANLRQLGTEILLYSNDHRGAYPPDLVTMATANGDASAAENFISPLTSSLPPRGLMSPVERTAWVAVRRDYIYRGAGQRNTLPADYVVAYDNPDRVTDTINILFGDGHVGTYDRTVALSLAGEPDSPPSDPPPPPAAVGPRDPLVEQSQAKLRAIAQDLQEYSNDFKAHLPATLGDMARDLNLPASLFVNPRSGNQVPANNWTAQERDDWINAHSDYAYLGAGQRASWFSAGNAMVYEQRAGLGGGINLLFGDGSVRFLEFPLADETLAPEIAPQVSGASFDAGASDTQSLTLVFPEDVSASLVPDDLSLATRDGAPVNAGPVTLDYDRLTQAATFTFPRLASGIYRATIAAGGVADTSGKPMPTDFTFDFATVAAGDRASLPAGVHTLKLDALAIDAGGIFDVKDGALIVENAAAGTWDGSAYDGIAGLVQSGRHGGDWGGAGIVTSSASGDDTTLGVATAADALGLIAAQTTTFGGETLDRFAVLVKFTYAGDANLDGLINIDDYTEIDSSVSAGGALRGWFNGDFNGDGQVNIDDYTLIDGNVGIQGPPL